VGWLRHIDVPARYRWAPEWLTSIVVGLAVAALAILARSGLAWVWPTPIPVGLMFPAILLATLVGRWVAGLTTFLAGALFTWLVVVPPLEPLRLVARGDLAILVLYLVVGGLILVVSEAYRQASRRYHEEQRLRAESEARRHALLADELHHRIKNTLATVQAIASQTLGHGQVDETVRQAFDQRLAALGRAHDLLATTAIGRMSLRDLVAAAIAPFDDGSRFHISGPDAFLAARPAIALSLGLHELATNAIKYGALSVQEGRVSIGWSIEDGQLTLNWTESAGPPVRPPAARGFGTRLLERSLPSELGGTVAIDYPEAGVCCQMRTPLPDV